MKCKFLSIILVLLMGITCVSIPVFASNQVDVVLDGELLNFDVPAQIIDGRTMVPVRAILENLGMDVTWSEDTQTVTASKKGVIIALTINDTKVKRNTIEQIIDVPAQIIDGRTLVPVRFVSEFAGATVEWDGATRTVYIKSTDSIKYVDWNETYEYWGEMDGSVVSGYGILYRKEDGTIFMIGKYNNDEIVEGVASYDSGDIFIGLFKENSASDGLYIWADGSYYVGQFENGLRSGSGEFYNAEQNVIYTGNYINGLEEGTFTITDNNLDVTLQGLFRGGEYLGELSQNGSYTNVQDMYYNTCAVQNCIRAPYSFSSYCFQHKCMDATCREKRASLISSYCINHECMLSNCTFNRVYNGLYCTSHECKVVGCHELANSVSFCCINHECAYPLCSRERAFNDIYCIYHKQSSGRH